MLSRKSLHRARIAVAILFWPSLTLVIWASLVVFTEPPLDFGLSFQDLIEHFIAYGGLSGMAAMALHKRRSAILAAAGLIALGATLEVLQSFTGRDMEFFDAVANGVGSLCGGISGRAIVEPLYRRYGLTSV
nr:MAG: hypothetical protein E4H34_02380 [Hyphomicrobiales bacterium]